MLRDLAIVIPTYNRSALLNRALSFYERSKFTGCIYVIDGSDKENAKLNKEHIDNKNLRIKYFYNQESTNEVIRMSRINHTIIEKYVTFAGDDDFQLPLGLAHCVHFLNNNKDYDVCFGIKFNFIMENDRPKMNGLNLGHDWDYNSPSQRFLEYMMTGNSTNYSVHRRFIWDRLFDNIDIPIRYIGTELVMCSTTAILSRIKRLNRIVTLYEDSGLSWPHEKCDTGCDLPPMFQLVHSYEWIESVEKFRNYIVDLLMKTENLSKYDATHIFNKGFAFRLYSMLEGQFCYKYGKEFTEGHKEFVRQANKERDTGRVVLFEDDLKFIEKNVGMDVSCLNLKS
jgi:glycosyltransferase domain-containing protein